jgi:mannonate dehydratase
MDAQAAAASEERARQRIAPQYTQSAAMPPAPWQDPAAIRITRVSASITAPDGVNLVIVRIETTEPGLIGWGCATFTQRAFAVAEIVDAYLEPLLCGRDVADISDIWQTTTLDAYWRGGPDLGSALAGVDEALWDIAGKRHGVPTWTLLGGRVRTAVETYTHASGRDFAELADQVEACLAAGYRHVRCQMTVPGQSTYGAAQGDASHTTWDPEAYVRMVPELFAQLRERFGDELEVIHDVHERVDPHQAIRLIRAVEEYRPFFMEDPVAPEDVEWLPRLRAQTAAPIAFGELVSDMQTFVRIVSQRQIDFVRCHISAIGGLTPARKLATVAELAGVRTAWHGPRDVSPIGHAVAVALDATSQAFGIHEHFEFSPQTLEIFPGTPETTDGSITPPSAPGLGVDFDEAAARRHPPVSASTNWHYSRVRRRDGSSQRP